MNRALLSLSCFFGLSSLVLAQQVKVPTDMPMPSRALSHEVLEELRDGMSWGEVPSEFWLELRPSAGLSDDEAWDYEAHLAMRADAVARLNDWDQGQRDAWLEASSPVPVELSYAVERAGGKPLLRGVESLVPGRAAALGPRTQHPVVMGFSGEIASQATIAEPITGSLVEGTALHTALYPIPGRGWWLEYAMVSNQALPSELIETSSQSIDGKARIRQQLVEWGGSVVLTPGKPVEMSLLDSQGGMLSLRFQVDTPAPQAAIRAGRFMAYDLPTLGLDPGLAGLQDQMRGALAWASPCGLLLVEPDVGGASIEELVSAVAEVPQVRLSLVHAMGEQPEQVRADLQSVAGRPLRFASGQLEDALVSWNSDVAAQARLLTPRFAWFFSGWRGDLMATTQSGEVRHSSMDLEVSSLSYGEAQYLQMAAARQLGGEGGLLPEETGLIESPLLSTRSFRADGRRSLIRFERGYADAQGRFIPDRLTFQANSLNTRD